MDTSRLTALIVFLFPLAYSPGPGNAFFASIGAGRGFGAAMPSLLGYHVATFAVTLLIGLGLELTVLTDPRLMRLLSLAGSLYVIWIGVTFLRSAEAETGSIAGSPDRPVRFVDGMIVLLLNPKAYLIIGLLFTQFLGQGSRRLEDVFAITAVFTVNNLVAFMIWTLAGAGIAAMLQSGSARRLLNAGFGLCMIGVGLWMLASAIQ